MPVYFVHYRDARSGLRYAVDVEAPDEAAIRADPRRLSHRRPGLDQITITAIKRLSDAEARVLPGQIRLA